MADETPTIDVDEKSDGPKITGLPGFVYYHKMYAQSCAGNDRKALLIFKEYESEEKIRRLKSEMLSVSQGRVPEDVCERILGKNRKHKFSSYPAWAKMMLSVLALKR